MCIRRGAEADRKRRRLHARVSPPFSCLDFETIQQVLLCHLLCQPPACGNRGRCAKTALLPTPCSHALLSLRHAQPDPQPQTCRYAHWPDERTRPNPPCPAKRPTDSRLTTGFSGGPQTNLPTWNNLRAARPLQAIVRPPVVNSTRDSRTKKSFCGRMGPYAFPASYISYPAIPGSRTSATEGSAGYNVYGSGTRRHSAS